MYKISKTFRFEAAHRLISPYQGKCSSLHGHSWQVRISIESDTLDPRGFVIDFGELAPLKTWIEANLDHATLVSSSDHALLNWLREAGQKHFVLDSNSTSENLAKRIFDEATALGLSPSSVEIRETCTSSGTYLKSKSILI